MNSRDTCIFYRSMYEAIKELPKEVQADIYDAIFSYSLDFKEPELTGIQKTVWTLIRPVLEKGNTNFINGNKPKQKRNRSESEANQKPIVSEVEAYKDKDKDKDEYKDKYKDVKTPEPVSFKKMNETDFADSIKPHLTQFGKELCTDFYNYWSEKSESGKMKFQLQKTWEVKKRLLKWQSNNFGNKQKSSSGQITKRNIPLL